MIAWNGGASHQDLKYWEGSKFGPAAFEMSGSVFLVGSVCALEVLQKTDGS